MSKVRTIEEIEMMAASEPFFGKGITVASGFDLGAKAPLDSRSIVHTIEERDAHVTGNRAYEGMLVYVVADKTTYQYTGTEWKVFGFNTEDFQLNVIDNLESDDATKALSARQGKILKGLIDVIEGRVDGVESDLENVYTKEEVDAIKDALDTVIAELENRVDAAEGQLADVEGLISDAVAEALVQAQAKAEELVEAAKQELVAEIGSVKSELENGIDTAKQELQGAIDSAKAELESKDSELAAAIENVRTSLEAKDVELTGKIEANAQEIAQINIDLATKADQSALDAEIARATGAEVALGGRIDDLEADVQVSIAEGVAEAKAHAEAKATEALNSAKVYADEKVADINASIEGIESSIEVIEGDIADLQAADVALGQRIDTVIGDYKAADAVVLSDAKQYTDEEVAKVSASVNDLDAAYKAADLVLEGKIEAAKVEAAADATAKADASLVEAKRYADTAVANLVDGAPESLDTLKEIADALNANDGVIETILEQIGTKADKATVEAELAKKADAATVNAELATKAEQSALEAEIARAEGAELALGGRIDGVVSSVELVEGRVDKLCEKLDLQGEQLVRIDNIESDIADLQGGLTDVEGSISDLEAEVNKLKVSVDTVKEFVTVDGQTDFELGAAPVAGSVKFFVNGIKYQAKYFSVVGTKVVWSGTLFEMPADCDVEVSFIAEV